MNTGSATRNHVEPMSAELGLLRRLYSQRRRCATVMAGALAVGLGFHVIFGQNGLTAYEQKRQDAYALSKQLQTLAEENERLKGHVDRLQSDPGAIERQARQELHYTRPGEVIVTLPNERPAAALRDNPAQ